MKRSYETVFILTPVLSEQQMEDTVEKFRDLLGKLDADIVNDEKWGLRKLAYPIDRKKSGYYHLFEHQITPENVANLELEMRRDERVIRFMTVALDKYAVEWNEKRRHKIRNQQTETAETEA